MEMPLRQAWWPSAQARVGLGGSGGAGEEDDLIAHPVFLDTRLAGINVTGSGERGCEDVGEADGGRGPAEALERAPEAGGGAAAASGRRHRRVEPGDPGSAAGAGALASEVPGGGCEGLKTKNAPDGELMRTRAKLGEMTMRVELQTDLLEKRGYGEELRKLLRRAGG